MRHALMAPHDLAWYYRPKRGKYRRRTDAPATKPKRGNRRGRIVRLGTSSSVSA
jgi:hypothetical protein